MALVKQITETAAHVTASQEWSRIPRTGETLEGLYRSQLFALIKTGEIKSAAVKQPGAARTGMRLINIPSLRQWIEKHVVDGSESEATA